MTSIPYTCVECGFRLACNYERRLCNICEPNVIEKESRQREKEERRRKAIKRENEHNDSAMEMERKRETWLKSAGKCSHCDTANSADNELMNCANFDSGRVRGFQNHLSEKYSDLNFRVPTASKDALYNYEGSTVCVRCVGTIGRVLCKRCCHSNSNTQSTNCTIS